MARAQSDTLGFKHRSALKLMTMANNKTPKGEGRGYLSAILYLSPHNSGGGVTLCPHSTPACREMCLAGSGMAGLPRQVAARQKRTDLYLNDTDRFIQLVSDDIARLVKICAAEKMQPVVRLNGTSDILWERVAPDLFKQFPGVQFMDYTKVPLRSRRNLPPNYHLTFSIEGPESMVMAVQYLKAGQSVAAVVDEKDRDALLGHYPRITLNGIVAGFLNGDDDDLRFLDPPGSVILLKPKGRIRTSLIRRDIQQDLYRAAGETAHA